MRTVILMMAIFLLGGTSHATGSDEFRLDPPIHCPGTDDLLQYDDGLAVWVTWGGLYRGVLFDLADFYDPVPAGFCIEQVDFWFYHASYYPWDTSDFYGEIWSGDGVGPDILEAQAQLIASHNSAVEWFIAPPCTVGQQFWVLVGTDFSSGGWPALLGDNTPSTTGSSHSFYSDDFLVWEPWIITGDTSSDYFIRVEGEPVDSQMLESMTWGLVKQSR